MTPATFAHRIWTTRRGVGMMLALLLLALVFLLYAIIASEPARVVSYGTTVIQPARAELCPGDLLRYPVDVNVAPSDLPVIWHVVEAWQRDDGLVLQSTSVSYEIPIVRPVQVSATAARTVPELPPGVYWLNHVAQDGRTTAYTVGPVTIRECTP